MQTCIWPSWCHCHSLSLASVKSRLVLPFWYWLTVLVQEKGPLNVCVCVAWITVLADERLLRVWLSVLCRLRTCVSSRRAAVWASVWKERWTWRMASRFIHTTTSAPFFLMARWTWLVVYRLAMNCSRSQYNQSEQLFNCWCHRYQKCGPSCRRCHPLADNLCNNIHPDFTWSFFLDGTLGFCESVLSILST